MAKKRKSGGRKTGRGRMVSCSRCGRRVPIDKAKKITKRVSIVERDVARDIRKQDGYVSSTYRTAYYCISCAVASHIVDIRASNMRDSNRPEKEQKTETQILSRGMEQKTYGEKKDEIEKDRRYDNKRTSKRKGQAK